LLGKKSCLQLIHINSQSKGSVTVVKGLNRGEEVQMPSSTVRIFAELDAYHAGIRAERVEGVVTARGNFHAELTRIDLDRLLMQRAEEDLPRVLLYAARPGRVAIIFATDEVQPAMHVSGMALARGDVIAWDSKLEVHHRSAAACRWGTMSLRREDLAVISEAIAERELKPPPFAHSMRPLAPVLARLMNLHEAASHLAKNAPDILAKPEVGRAIEQGLVEAMVWCLTSGDAANARSAHHHHAAVMRRLEEVLQANSEEPLYMAELCTAARASYPTLRACCQEHLGMSPKRYLWLRRMHLAQRALRGAGPEGTTVTDIATNYGFWELGRFAVAYRSLFGESPSTTLRRPPEGPKTAEILGSAWEFTKSA
jgi:AraC-like DNA-binding protein